MSPSTVGARPWLVTAGALGLAGTLQLLPSTRRSLAAARRLGTDPGEGASSASSAFYAGQLHGRRSLRSDGPLMLVMFAVGGGLGWMAILALLMVGERSASGSRLAVATGVALLAAAAVVALNQPWLPFAFGDVA